MHPPYTPYSIGNSSRAIFKTHRSQGGLDNSQSHSANVFRVDDPRLEARVLHELIQNKMAEDSESDITYGIGCVWGMPSLSPLSSLANSDNNGGK